MSPTQQDPGFADRLLDTLPVIVLVLDRDARILRFNRFMEEVSGHRLDDVRGKDWFDTFLPGRDHERIRALFHKAITGREVVGNTNPILTRTGEEREIEWFGTTLKDANDETVGLLSVGRDITEQLQVKRDLAEHQAQIQSVVRAVIDPIVATDVKGIVLATNPAVTSVFGWEQDELLGRNVRMLMGSPYREEHDGYLQHYLETGEKRAIGKVRKVLGRRKNGEEFAAEISISEVVDGGQMRFVGIVRDISEREDMMAKLAQSERLAAIGELAAGVAHEVNNPVNTIMNCAQLLADGDEDPELCQDILHEGGRIAGIVQGLLDFARERDEDFHVVDLGEVTRKAVSLVQRRLMKSGIDMLIHVQPGLPAVRGRFQQLEQVVLNLLLNARDALRNHESRVGKTIHVVVERGQDQGWPHVFVAVCDNGPGIPQHQLQKIFEPFFTTKRETGGTGLGLSISKGIVESHGGRMWARSDPGSLTELRVSLPLADDGTRPSGATH